ncbi:conserved hypothetical protein [Trichinella spiralis]|uniref:hypothetical protein n=1 Tax=Trichinella spiralis TaxID=6334 RepID=UPI0001EFC50F|nr:conserved hypothetical protein [Trichinella spiralis]
MDKMKLSKEETIALLKRAVNSVAEKDAFPIWKTVINWYSCNAPSKLEEQLESALLSTSIVSNYAKLNASQSVEVDALGNIRKLFNRLRLIAPNELKFYRFYINIELSQNVKSTKHIRSAYEFALLEHGKDCLKIWLEYMQFESDCTEGDPCRCSRIYSQALKNLRPDLVKQFVESYTLLVANGATINEHQAICCYSSTFGKLKYLNYVECQIVEASAACAVHLSSFHLPACERRILALLRSQIEYSNLKSSFGS